MMKLVGGGNNADVHEDLRDMAKDLRYIATLIEQGKVNAVALVFTGTDKEEDERGMLDDGVCINWLCRGGSAYTVSGALSQLQHEIHHDITTSLEEDDD
jgi:hypothetical protein